MYTSVHLVVSLERGIHDLCILLGSFDLSINALIFMAFIVQIDKTWWYPHGSILGLYLRTEHFIILNCI